MASETTVKKTPKSAVIIMPPEDTDGWRQIQAIREKHDKSYVRWMPHVNMVYPFIFDENDGIDFQDAAEKFRDALKDFKPFTIKFSKSSFGYFSHSKSSTLWLKPLTVDTPDSNLDQSKFTQSEAAHHPSVLDLQERLVSVFPACNDVNTISEKGFQPHLSLGQFQHSAVDKFALKFQQEWQDFEFEVKEVCLISRKDFHDPFHVRHTVRLDG